jgi:hypothetical protein
MELSAAIWIIINRSRAESNIEFEIESANLNVESNEELKVKDNEDSKFESSKTLKNDEEIVEEIQ